MDIIIFAIVAIVLFYRLYTVLGRDDGPIPQKIASPVVNHEVEQVNPRDKLDQLLRRYNIPLFLKPAFSAIVLKDPTFDFKDFLEGAEGAYELILRHALQGDLDKIQSYISPQAKTRLSQLPHLERFRVKIIATDIVGAEADIPNASITVQFKSTVKDIQRLEDWVFSRDLDSEDPTWVLKEIMSLNPVG
ncbi:MAG: TIM44-like domain-containing protein [Alphaproteobacteria bacterium]|nr:TIM44-like domain-containing protein [Alphaproteobacteria bacterium]